MSTRYNNGSHYENHQRAAELHESAAHAHLSASEAREKQEHQTGHELSRRALEHTQQAHEFTGQMRQKPANQRSSRIIRHQDIAALARELWQARGCPEGSPDVDWFQAAEELRLRAEVSQK